MNRLAKNSIAAGLTTLLVTTGLSFSAFGATETTSYAEAQFIAAFDDGLGAAVNPLGDALEEGGSNACEPATEDCLAQAFTQSPLEPLEDLTIPVGDNLTGSELGAAGNYAEADNGASRAASGAVTQDGIVQAGGGNGAADANATLNLGEGVLGDTGVTDALANLRLEIGAISSSIELDSPSADPVRDYNIAGADAVLTVPALGQFGAAIDAVGDVDLSDIDLSTDTLCVALGGSLDVALRGLGLGTVTNTLLRSLGLVNNGQIDLCDNAVVEALGEANVLQAKITGLNAVTEGLTAVTQDGVTFDFAAGEIRIDLAAAAEAVLGTDINNLPPNTDILAAVLPSLALNIDDLIDDLNANVVQQLQDNFDVELTLLGADVPIDPLNDAVREELLPNLSDALTELGDVFADTLGDSLAEGLTTLTDGLDAVAQIIVNVPDKYTSLRSDDAPTTLAAGDVFSQSAVEIRLLDGALADILLANTLVGPNTATEVDVDGPADDGPGADGPGADGPGADGPNANADANADGTPVASIADADSAADADVQASLPNAGAPNLLPFFLLGIALLAFGLAVLLNERRRLGLPSSDNLA